MTYSDLGIGHVLYMSSPALEDCRSDRRRRKNGTAMTLPERNVTCWVNSQDVRQLSQTIMIYRIKKASSRSEYCGSLSLNKETHNASSSLSTHPHRVPHSLNRSTTLHPSPLLSPQHYSTPFPLRSNPLPPPPTPRANPRLPPHMRPSPHTSHARPRHPKVILPLPQHHHHHRLRGMRNQHRLFEDQGPDHSHEQADGGICEGGLARVCAFGTWGLGAYAGELGVDCHC